MMDPKEKADRARSVAYALRHVLTLDAEAPEACARLAQDARALEGWLEAVRRDALAAPGLLTLAGLPALWAALQKNAGLAEDRAALEAAGVTLATLQAVTPDEAREAYADTLANARDNANRRRIEDVEKAIAAAKKEKTPDALEKILRAAGNELTRVAGERDAPLAEIWQAHLDRRAEDDPGPGKVLRLRPERKAWAAWFNDNLGERGGLEPGETFIIGGAWEAGKTGLAALLAVDAMAAGCPVLFWQLELSREETLEHLQAQRHDLSGWPLVKFRERGRVPLPAEWTDLLTIPRMDASRLSEMENVEAAMINQARRAERMRGADKARHACNGLVVVDYMQLLTMKDGAPIAAKHDVLATAASRLAKAAADNGACLLLLSQLNKQAQREGDAEGTALAGADLARMGHRVAILQKAGKDGKACAGNAEWITGKGEMRLLTWKKRRGMRDGRDGQRPAESKCFYYSGSGRAFHDKDGDFASEPAAKGTEGWTDA